MSLDLASQRIFKNASLLFGANALASVAGLASLVLTTRVLGPDGFGLLILMGSYVAIVSTLVNFKSWQAIIKFGTVALEEDDAPKFLRLLKFGFMLDALTAALGALFAIVGAPLVGRWFGWTDEVIMMTVVLAGCSVFNWSSTPTAILRLFNRFNVLALHESLSALFKLALIVIAYFGGGSLLIFILIAGGVGILSNVFLFGLAIRALRSRKLRLAKTPWRGAAQDYPELWTYVWTTNFHSSIRMAAKELDVIIVGSMLGSGATGLYAVAKRFANLLTKFSGPLYQAIYPELAKLVAQESYRALVQLIVRGAGFASAIAVVGWLVFVVWGEWILSLSVGLDYIGAYGVLIWYMLALVLAVGSFPLQPVMLALGRPRTSFWIHLLTTLLYLAVLPAALARFGLMGAGMAFLLYYVIWCTVMTATFMLLVRPLLRRRSGPKMRETL